MKINLKKKVINPRKYTPSPPPRTTVRVWISSYVRGLIFNRYVNRHGKKKKFELN